MPKKILIINPFGIGDVLFSTVVISAIKQKDPGSHIGYICNIRTNEILQTNPDVSEVFVFERDEYRSLWKERRIECVKRFFNFWSKIRKEKFDIAIDLSLGKEYAFLCWLIGIKERRGFNYKGRGRFLTHKIAFDGFNDKPVAEYYLSLIPGVEHTIARGTWHHSTVLVSTDKDRVCIDGFLRRNEVKEDDLLVGVAPGGGVSFGKKDQRRRRWSASKFSEVADRVVEKFNAKIVLISGPEEENLVREIAGYMKEKSLVAPKTSIREMAALCKRCRMVICSEGGPLHIASSQGVNTLSIFGPVDEKVYGPYPPSDKNIVIKSNIECRPCYKRFKIPKCNNRQCLEDVSVDTVFERIINSLTSA